MLDQPQMTESHKFFFIPNTSLSATEIIDFDWEETSLGSIDQWPSELKNTVQLMLTSHFPKAIIWGDDLITLFNDAFRPMLGGKIDCMGKPFNLIWKEAWAEIEPKVHKAFKGEATFIEDIPLVINRYGYDEQCYFTFCYNPLLDENGNVSVFIDTVIESTAKVEAINNATIINAELAHRIKNTFSIIQSIATQTFGSIEHNGTLPVFIRRIHALSNAHEVLRVGCFSTGALDQIINGIIVALGLYEKVKIVGPTLLIGPKAALSTSLLVNELATNALKYGALSSVEGTVTILWKLAYHDNETQLVLEWTEENGPLVKKPESKGFGSRLIKMGLLGIGGAEIIYNPEGLKATFTAPLLQTQGEGTLFN